MTHNELIALEEELCHELEVCCGATTEVLDLTRKVLTIMRLRSDLLDEGCSATSPAVDLTYTQQDQLLGYDDDGYRGLGYAFLNNLHTMNLTEHGSAVRCSWPTKRGLALLERLETWAKARNP